MHQRTRLNQEEQEEQRDQREKAQKSRSTKERRVAKSWEKIAKEPAIRSLVSFLEGEVIRNQQVGQTGVGFSPEGGVYNEKTRQWSGHEVRFTNEQRISFMDKGEEAQMILDYIKRKTK